MRWTPERDAELTSLVQAGLSSRQAGLKLHVTRNAAIGRAHRLKLHFGLGEAVRPGAKIKAVAKPKAVTKPRPVEKPRIVPLKAPPKLVLVMPEGSLARHWMTRRHGECAWPIGDGADLFSCCAPIAGEGLSYCPKHHKLAHRGRATSLERDMAAAEYARSALGRVFKGHNPAWNTERSSKETVAR